MDILHIVNHIYVYIHAHIYTYMKIKWIKLYADFHLLSSSPLNFIQYYLFAKVFPSSDSLMNCLGFFTSDKDLYKSENLNQKPILPYLLYKGKDWKHSSISGTKWKWNSKNWVFPCFVGIGQRK